MGYGTHSKAFAMGPDRPDQVDFERGSAKPLLRTAFSLLPFLCKEFSPGLSQPEHEIWFGGGGRGGGPNKKDYFFLLPFIFSVGKARQVRASSETVAGSWLYNSFGNH